MKKVFTLSLLFIVLLVLSGSQESFQYRSPEEITKILQRIAREHGSSAELHELGQTTGERHLLLLELGKRESDVPAIMVVANMEGNCPLASEAALMLSQLLVDEWKEELETHRWYIVPLGNPDGYAHFFGKPLRECFRNARPFNDDNDDSTDEDGQEDLNGDGYITMMRQVHPEGRWMKVEGNPVLLKKADEAKGEQGAYRLFTEGLDNDGDGQINEDGPGGANPGHNFPHEFQHYTTTDGPWAASETESRAVLQFAFDHPEIALILTFGRTNSLKKVPESSKRAEATQSKYKVPERMAKRLGLDPDTEYPLQQLLEMARDYTGYKDLTEDMLLQWLDAGAAVNPDRKDLPYWKEISEKYNDFIKEAKLEGKRLDPPGFSSGCIEEWAYYQYGVLSFSMDFWTIPIVEKKEEKDTQGVLTPDSVENMSNEEFINLGKERIETFLKKSGAPAQYTADMVIRGLEGGMMTTKRMAEMLREMKKEEEAGGADEMEQALYEFTPEAFVEWQMYDHPTLGELEIGGKIPYADLAPPAHGIEELLEKQLPFVRELVTFLPEIAIEDVVVGKKSTGVWSVEAWIGNQGFLPYPTHQGQRCKRPTPAVASLKGESLSFLENRERIVLKLLEGSGGVQKVRWLIAAKDGSQVTVTAHSFSAGADERKVTLKGGGEK
jgi:hypothetical protein